MTTQNLKRNKSIHHLKNRKGIRLLNDLAIIKPLAAKQADRLAEEIKALKQQMEFVLGITKTGLDIIDSEFNIRYIDPEWAKIYGDPTGKKCFEYFMDRSGVCPHCGIPTAFKTKAVTVTEELLAKEGNRPIQVSTIPFQNEKGEWLVAEVNVDISERKQVEEALRKAHEELEIRVQERTAELARANEAMQTEITEHTQAKKVLRDSEERYRTLTEAAQDIIFIIDAEDRVQYINSFGANQLEREPKQIIGKPRKEFFPSAVSHRQKMNLQKVFEAGKPLYVENEFFPTDHIMWLSTRLVPIRNDAGEVAAVLGISRDTTERKRIEEALRESQQLLKKTFVSLREAVFIIDAKTTEIVDCNPTATEIFGYSREEMLGQTTIFLHVDKAMLEEFRKHMYANVEEKGFLHLPELRMKRKNGDIFFTEHSVMPLEDDKGKLISWVSVVRDITQRKRAEEALRKSEEESKKLAHENAIMAEIGRIISSTLNIEEVYERFAEEVRKLISFDRIAIRTINSKDSTVTIAYTSGGDRGTHQIGYRTPLPGSVAEECIRTQSAFLFQPESEDEVLNRFPNVVSTFKAGLRSMVFVPLISKDQVIGVLSFQATKPNAYTGGDLRLAERVGDQIAGAVANAHLFIQLKRTEEALRESESKFRDLYDNAPLGYHEYNQDGRITKVNQTDLDMLGYAAAEMVGRPIWTFNVGAEVTREQVLAKLAGTLPPGRNLERTYRRKDGTTFPVLIQDRLILDEKNKIKGIRCTIQDITGIKQAEESLQRSEERAKRIAQENVVMAEIGQIISSTLNIDDVYERFAEKVRSLIPFDRITINIVNPENNTATMAYVTGVDIPGRRSGDIIPLAGTIAEECTRTLSSFLFQPESPDEGINRFPILLLTFKAGLRSMMSVPLISKDKIMGILHLLSTKPKAYSEGDVRLAERIGNQIAGAIANVQLFTERKRTEESLRKSEEKFQKLFDEAPVGYMELDAKGCITQVNRTELTMLGYTQEEMVGQPLWKFVVEEEAAREKIKAKLSGSIPSSKSLERTYKRKDGTTLPVVIEDALIRDVDGRITGIHATIRDVSEHKRVEKEMADLQEQLRQSQKIEAIGQLAGGIAHDFNNLLTVIKGYAQLSLLDLKENNPLWENIQEIQKATQRATDLTRQLLAFSRRQILDPKVLDLNSLLRDTEKMLRRMIGEDIELVTLLSEDLGRVKIDPGQIEQVILNLAVNARDAMPSGGKLRIETANVESEEGYALTHLGVIPGHYVRLSVSDTGVGMSREVQEKAFDPFFTTKEKGKGTGLGLSTVHGIVTQSGGKIWVYSEPGHGTTFKIYFPTIEGALDAVTGKNEPDSFPTGSETVLLVEDEPSVRDLANRLLKQQGYRVLEAANGEEALRLAQDTTGEKIHLLLTDVVLPQMGGKELADQLKLFRPDLKVLYTSGYTDYAIVHHGVLDSGTHFLQKPFSLKTLSQKIREALDK